MSGGDKNGLFRPISPDSPTIKKQPSVAKNFKVRIYGSKTTNTDEAVHLPIAFIFLILSHFFKRYTLKNVNKKTQSSAEN